MSSLKKMIVILFIISLLVILFPCYKIFAVDDTNFFKPNNMSTEDEKFIAEKTGIILGYVRNAGIILSVIMLTIIGLKYIISSVDEKANYKENFVIYIAGCFLLACATMLPSIVYNIMN